LNPLQFFNYIALTVVEIDKVVVKIDKVVMKSLHHPPQPTSLLHPHL
jgi:hypothetical protein